MHPIVSVLASSLLLATAFAAQAQNTSQPASSNASTNARSALQERLIAADINGDRYIDRQEANAKLPRIARNFDLFDSDRDGRLSAAEMQAMAERLRQMQAR